MLIKRLCEASELMNPSPNLSQYCVQMDLIKKRIEVIESFENGNCRYAHLQPMVEAAYLQFRKILELIAMGSLVANKEIYSKEHKKFSSHWNARRILNSLEKLNPDFFPMPLNEKYQGKDLIEKKSGFLTKVDFIQLYDICGAILHTDNPFGKQCDYEFHHSKIGGWVTLITELLCDHRIQLFGDPNWYVIHMSEKRDNKVHGYTFALLEEAKNNLNE